MDDLNEMLSKLMEDPQAMEQLKATARALGIDPDGPPPPGFGIGAGSPPPAPQGNQAPMPDLSALAALLGAQNNQQHAPPPAIDPAALKLLQGVMLRLNQPDKNVDLLRALKPHFSPQRGARVDNAIRLMQLVSLLPVLRESGLLAVPPQAAGAVLWAFWPTLCCSPGSSPWARFPAPWPSPPTR